MFDVNYFRKKFLDLRATKKFSVFKLEHVCVKRYFSNFGEVFVTEARPFPEMT